MNAEEREKLIADLRAFFDHWHGPIEDTCYKAADELERLAGEIKQRDDTLAGALDDHFKSRIANLEKERDRLAEEVTWVRNKIGVPLDVEMASLGGVCGTLHAMESHAHGYERYIVAHKCDDLQGEIARQHVEIERLSAIVVPLERLLAKEDECMVNINKTHGGFYATQFVDGSMKSPWTRPVPTLDAALALAAAAEGGAG